MSVKKPISIGPKFNLPRAVGNYKHGKSKTVEYQIWSGIRRRCLFPKCKDFHFYGGRGITICDRWKNSFPAFLEDMGPRPSRQHSIDRIDSNGNYEPGNCRWATPDVQSYNRRNASYIERNGRRIRIVDLAEQLGVRYETIYSRLMRGWDFTRATTTPTRPRSKNKPKQ